MPLWCRQAVFTGLAAVWVLCWGCSKAPLSIPEGCNPLLAAAEECFLPYPSDFFRTSGQVAFYGPAKLHNDMGVLADVTDFRPSDGFSRVSLIAATLGRPLKTDRLIGILDPPEQSLSHQSSATLIIDSTTQKTVAHFADLDPFAKDPAHQALILQTFVSLKEETRYVVAFAGVLGQDHEPVPPPEGFRRLRDGDTGSDPALAKLRSHYETAIFPMIEAQGIKKVDIQLAWDFTTGSDQDVTHDMLHVRELALAHVASQKPAITVDAVDEPTTSQAPGVWRFVRGTITGPLFLDSAQPGVGALVRDGSGAVVQSGTLAFPYVALVPLTVRDDAGPARIIAYGHGFFGSRRELENDSPQLIANRLHAILISIDWWGMSEPDRFEVIDALTNRPARMLVFADRVHQALSNWIVTSAAMGDGLTRLDAFHRPTDPTKPGVTKNPDGSSNAGQLLYDLGTLYYLGLSQGHMLGGAIASLVPAFKHLCLNVGGAAWTHLMFRASPFEPFLTIMSYTMGDPLLRQKFAVSLQRQFDRIDPAIYARYVLSSDLPMNPPDRHVLLQVGIGDVEVPWISGFFHARLLGAGLTTPSAADVWGLDTFADQRAALTVFDLGVDPSFIKIREPPLSDTPVHEGIRRLETAQKEMDALFHPTATVMNPCNGPCRSPP
jgi:hypothetical protein